MPLGVPWSKRTSIVGRGRRDLNRWRIQAASCKFEHSPDLFRRHMELLNDFLDAGARFEILEDRRHGHPCTSKNPCTAAPARHAFHYRTLRPVKCCHRESPFVILAHGCVSPSGAGRSPLDSQRDRKSTRLNSSHGYISYAVFCLKKKKKVIKLTFAICALARYCHLKPQRRALIL